jgi:S1-C subfamily serine protease
MSAIDDPPIWTETGQPPPAPPRPGYGGAGGPGGPAGEGGGSEGPGRHVRRFRRGVLAAFAAIVAALGAVVGLQAATGTAGALTTSQITAQTDPGLVDVVSTLGYQQAEAAGTGLVLTPSGEVLTNNHVIEGATSIRVIDIGNRHSYRATVVGYDQSKDIAVLQLRGASGLKTVSLGSSAAAAVGQKVTAIGNAGGRGGTPSVVTGKITRLGATITASDQGSGTTERLTGLISDNAAIQPGDSGGPLVSTSGQVIGIDTAASTATGFRFQSEQTQTEAFAIPIDEAVSIASQIEGGTASPTVHIGATGFLGVEILPAGTAAQDGVPAGTGAAVAGVLPGSAAQSAGIAAGDVITSVDGRPVSSPSTLQSAMERHHPGDSVSIGWTNQAGQSQSATVHLATGPAQ